MNRWLLSAAALAITIASCGGGEEPQRTNGDSGSPGATTEAAPGAAQDSSRSRAPEVSAARVEPPTLEDLPERLVPGLALELAPVGGRNGALSSDVRAARTLALHVPAGRAPSPFVGEGPFVATWRGKIDLPRRDNWSFAFEGRCGSFVLKVDGEPLLELTGKHDEPALSEPKRLKKGAHEIEVIFRSPLLGAASMRISWKCRRFALEPVPPSALSHDADDEAARLGTLRRRGRQLIAEGRCTACHAAPEGAAMPELAMAGPDLTGVGDRLQAGWVRAWVHAPRALRAAARMPHVLRGDEPEQMQKAADLATFLGSLRGEAPQTVAGDAEAGARLFGDLGCFTCHAFGNGTADQIDLSLVAQKYALGALAAFVLEPGRHDPWIRMPDLKLSVEEAGHLEAYLRSRPSIALAWAGPTDGDVERGAALFASEGCAHCHAIDGGGVAEASAKPLLDVLTGAGCSELDYGYGDAERLALHAFAASLPAESLARVSWNEFATRQLAERRCIACHELDGQTSWWVEREGDLETAFGVPPRPEPADGHTDVAQLRPKLTVVGEKLQPAWMVGFLSGDIESPRPWLHARMPRLPRAVAEGITEGLAHQHGFGADEVAPKPLSADVEAGRKLVGQNGGFGCVTCHAINGKMPTALFEVQGIDLMHAHKRLRRGFYDRWMWDPSRIDASTKMPTYATKDGTTAFEAYGGNAKQQFDAIWSWLHGGQELK